MENNELTEVNATIPSLEGLPQEVIEYVHGLVAENARMREIIDAVTDLDNEPQYHEVGMGCGLEDRGITDRYEAMRHGWDAAMERVYGEVIPCDEELEFKVTDAAIAEIKAQGGIDALESLAGVAETMVVSAENANWEQGAFGWSRVKQEATKAAANLRAGRKG